MNVNRGSPEPHTISWNEQQPVTVDSMRHIYQPEVAGPQANIRAPCLQIAPKIRAMPVGRMAPQQDQLTVLQNSKAFRNHMCINSW